MKADAPFQPLSTPRAASDSAKLHNGASMSPLLARAPTAAAVPAPLRRCSAVSLDNRSATWAPGEPFERSDRGLFGKQGLH